MAFLCINNIDTVNMASRMESTGIPNRVQISRQTYERVHDLFKVCNNACANHDSLKKDKV